MERCACAIVPGAAQFAARTTRSRLHEQALSSVVPAGKAGEAGLEKEIRDRFGEQILQEAQGRYGLAPGETRLLDGFESFIYEFERDGRAYILRLGHSRRRTPDLIRGEVDWINFLAAGGAGVAAAVDSANGDQQGARRPRMGDGWLDRGRH
jgi:hypothetical protein